jgi:hypothetical protein
MTRKNTTIKSELSASARPQQGPPSCVATAKPAEQNGGGIATIALKAVPSRPQIAERATAIWRTKGCPRGQDVQNWLEAEAQLKREMGTA